MKNTNIHYMLQVSDFIHRLVDKKTRFPLLYLFNYGVDLLSCLNPDILNNSINYFLIKKCLK